MLFTKRAGLMLLIIIVMGAFGTAYGAASGSFVFDYAGDVGDNSDGPQYDITLSGPTDDGGICDWVVMIMFDTNGVVVDVDPNCVNPGTGIGSDDGDYGVINVPTSRPITYSLFDVDGAEARLRRDRNGGKEDEKKRTEGDGHAPLPRQYLSRWMRSQIGVRSR